MVCFFKNKNVLFYLKNLALIFLDMTQLHKEFTNIHYKKITWADLEKLPENVLQDIVNIDRVTYRRNADELRSYIKRRIENHDKTIFYLMYNGSELLGSAIGHIKSISGNYNLEPEITKRYASNDTYFSLTELNVNSKYQKKGLGTMLLERVIADQRAKHDSRFILIRALFPETQKITDRATGKKPFLIEISKKDRSGTEIKDIKNVLRSFANSKHRYNLFTVPESKTNPGPSKLQYMTFDKNPDYKKKNIIRKVK